MDSAGYRNALPTIRDALVCSLSTTRYLLGCVRLRTVRLKARIEASVRHPRTEAMKRKWLRKWRSLKFSLVRSTSRFSPSIIISTPFSPLPSTFPSTSSPLYSHPPSTLSDLHSCPLRYNYATGKKRPQAKGEENPDLSEVSSSTPHPQNYFIFPQSS